MTERERRTHVIRTADQLRALRNPLRFRIVTALRDLAACSVAQLAESLELPRPSLYYHMHQLQAVGLVHAVTQRRAGRRSEKVYRLLADDIAVDIDNRTPDFLAALGDVYSAVLRSARRELLTALESEQRVTSGPRCATDVRQTSARLDQDDHRRLKTLLAELGAFLAKHDQPGAARYSLTTALSLVPSSVEGD